jgi:hypothetical protein
MAIMIMIMMMMMMISIIITGTVIKVVGWPLNLQPVEPDLA